MLDVRDRLLLDLLLGASLRHSRRLRRLRLRLVCLILRRILRLCRLRLRRLDRQLLRRLLGLEGLVAEVLRDEDRDAKTLSVGVATLNGGGSGLTEEMASEQGTEKA